mmetsp:Transcript_2855/g.4578  ORF Transcript_2855/g.4578 Transcript_2855/m.4578 type:complete len:251 (+) Transcript_2855:2-754(+)
MSEVSLIDSTNEKTPLIKKQNNVPPNGCVVCGNAYPTQRDLKIHFSKRHGDDHPQHPNRLVSVHPTTPDNEYQQLSMKKSKPTASKPSSSKSHQTKPVSRQHHQQSQPQMVLVPVPMQTSGTTVTVISQKGFGKKKQKVVTTQVRSDGQVITTKTKNGKAKPLKAKDHARVQVVTPEGGVVSSHRTANDNNASQRTPESKTARVVKPSGATSSSVKKAAACPFCQKKNQYAQGTVLVCCYNCHQTFGAPP